ncbi:class IIb bacteriocin, lactobin A/cerein 7B family [Neisseria sp. oral taxon 014]|nr:class IIb bacteriocin, lactobin A/cerein 7B family [Neisseria sp. oral taxon 014]
MMQELNQHELENVAGGAAVAIAAAVIGVLGAIAVTGINHGREDAKS